MGEDQSLEAILEGRAKAYRERGLVSAEELGEECIVFQLQTIRCAVRIDQINEVVPFPVITPVAQTPEAYLGVFSLRGSIHGAFCPDVLLGGACEHRNFLLMLGSGRGQVGVSIQDLEGKQRLNLSQAGPINDSRWPKWLSHQLQDGLFVLDPVALLNHLDGIFS